MNDKRNKIINAALEEFFEKGYDKASTLNISKKAGVSKGLIFHYFGNKEKLYVYLVKYSLEVTVKEFLDKLVFKSNDIMERLKEILIYKLKIMDENPALIDFMSTAYFETNDESYKELLNQRDEISKDVYNRLFENIDYSVFKDGIDVNDALKVMQWTFDSAGKEYLNEMRKSNKKVDPIEIEQLFNRYISILSKGIYKED